MPIHKHFPDLEVEILNESETYAEVVAQPFERGYGVTVGNSLRRVLMTAVPGVAITSVRFDGISHEFTTIKGVVEDIPEIVMNLKKVRFKLIDEIGPEMISMNIKGPCEITGADINNAAQFYEVLNPDVHIATLMDNADVSCDIRISRGKGYTPAIKNKIRDAVIGTIAIDSIFNPITNVAWDVQPIPTSIEGFEKLILEIKSDGSTSPKDAVNHCALILRKMFTMFMFNDSAAILAVNEEEVNEAVEVKEILNKNIDEMELSVRSYNCLQSAGIQKIGELVAKEESEMLKFKNFGRKSLNELVEKLESMGLEFSMDVSQYIDDEDEL